MPTWNKRTKGDKLSKSVVINTSNSIERDIFLDLATSLLASTDTRIDSRLHRVELTISGPHKHIDSLQAQLRKFSGYTFEATNPDKNGRFTFQNVILTKLFKPPLSLQLFAECIQEFGFEAEVHESALTSTANIDELKHIYQTILERKQSLPTAINKDIERFLIITSLAMDIQNLELLLALALEHQCIKSTDTGFQFAIGPEKARDKLLKLQNQETLQENMEKHNGLIENPTEMLEFMESSETAVSFETSEFDVEALSSGLFDGGKIVFYEDGKETSKFDETDE